MIDIIVPFHNQVELTLKCIDSIERYTSDYHLITIDNYSDIPTRVRILLRLSELSYRTGLTYNHVFNKTNLGYIKAINQGLGGLDGDFCVLLNNDAEVVEGWVEKLIGPMREDKSIGGVGPVTTDPTCWQGREKRNVGWRILPPSAMLAFFCVMFRREVIEEVGFLDEDFGVGYCEDDDYCQRVKKAGWKLALNSDLIIPHKAHSTFNTLYRQEEIEKTKAENLRRYKEKHGL